MKYLILICLAVISCSQRPINETVYFRGRKEVIRKHITGRYDLVSQVVDDCYGNHDTSDITSAGAWMHIDKDRMNEGDKFGKFGPYKWMRIPKHNHPDLSFRVHQQSVQVFTEPRNSYTIGGWEPICIKNDTLIMHKLLDDGYHSPTVLKNYYRRITN